MYYLGSGQSSLNCDDVSTNSCVAPQGTCSSWESPSCEFRKLLTMLNCSKMETQANQSRYYCYFSDWYVRNMASRINSHFKYAHEKLQDSSIRNLALIDQMIIDFKMDPPDTDALKEVLATIAGGKYIQTPEQI